MRNDHTRAYAIAAFRFYAVEGSAEGYRQRIWNEAVADREQRELRGESGTSAPTESAIIHAEAALKAKLGAIADLEAVEKTMHIIAGLWPGNIRARAVKMVYMAEPERKIERGEISERVHEAEIYLHTSERNIWRWLSDACVIFAVERILNTQEWQEKRYARLCGSG